MQTSPGLSQLADLLVVAIHGIMNRTTTASWNDSFDEWMWKNCRYRNVKVLKKEYIAGPFPAWNVWIKNHFLAWSVVNEVMMFARDGVRIAFVVHSNGGDIAMKAVKILASKGVTIEVLILTGAAVQEDIDKNGIAALVKSGRLRRAISYSSPNDMATSSILIWPYGRLGHEGFMRKGRPFPNTEQIWTRWFSGYSHGQYFSQLQIPGRRGLTYEERTFTLFARDLGIELKEAA